MIATLEREYKTRDPMLPTPYRVLGVKQETADTYTLELAPANPNDRISFAPGQFNMLYAFGVGEVPISVSGDPSDLATLVHTVRAVGPVTEAICKLTPRQVLGVRGPLGTSWPGEELIGQDVVIVAGGIGLAPLRPTIYQIAAHREQYGNVVIMYGARKPADLLFQGELETWRERFDMQVEVTVDAAEAGWTGNVGVVTKLMPRADFDPARAIALVCGPEIMMRFTIMELQKRGVLGENIYISMERNMKCGVGLCGHCQWGPYFICKDGPVFRYDALTDLFGKREV